ncbi:2-methoxy-6-polyprenyl-1,4-benzoquinol methylase, mitochondrial [Tribolium castaneum]|uniref:2-methoxy-6-polyprenyl-1,4-benzoquinol methylase, mitochondrial n=1 Tax=Tribolium castaneum TaxID=7070 RepID=A0A139WH00_TRICA|nr:PREDICTED: 2-methoxy-6-polyprenyl-1,4-benzoquinol methylase, mitochondrial [Tribolium castaneum]KYB27131.1 2-methoxy-6-polyprenyl-1,4-benzoquinol methylase, mitochondrial-like Protein [Tribolium castaneum]|eukprot:XP_972630.1 PREDICTED: 2-methoxy-6-polyprenyl-1,4-benzoquinol methylase, mitochondrial [Tribolium castaneum]
MLTRHLSRFLRVRAPFRGLNTSQTTSDDKETHFGFQTVRESEKAEKVYSVFENVAGKYDLMNDAMSLGIHRVWKDIFMCRLGPTQNTKLLDMAGGTGDIAFRFLNYIKNNNVEKNCHVTVCDINADMLEVGKARSRNLNHDSALISWEKADAENLHFKNDSFNAYTIAFGIRNCTHIDRVLQEAYRVLQPGGRFMCLEFSQVENETIRWFYDKYSFQVIPVLGHILAGQWQAYQYLVESIRKFPDQETFKTMIEEAGFRVATYENLNNGIVAIHSAFKL